MIKFPILNHVLRFFFFKETRTEFWSIELDNGTIYLMTKQKILKLDNKLVNRFSVLSLHWFNISLACWRQVYLTCLVGNVFTFLIYLLVYSFVLWFFFYGKGLILIDIIKTSGTKRKSTMTHINFFEVVCGWSAIPVDISLNQ